MSWFDLVAGRLGLERRPEAKARPNVNGLQIPYAWPAWRAGQPDWTPATLQGYAEAGYEGNSLVLACIRRRAQSAAFAPLVAYTGQRAEPQRLPDKHPLAQLLRRPNPYQSWYEFMEQGITYLDLDGNLFIFKAAEARGASARQKPPASAVGGRQGFPSALYLLRSDRVRVVPGRERGQPLLGYVYDADDSGQWLSREPFLPEEIIHVKYPNPRDPFEGFGRGTSPLGAAAKQVDVDNAATSFLKTFFDQGVVPYGLLKSKQTLVDEEVQRIRDRLKAQYAGQQNWGETLILDADADYQRMGMSFQEMTFDALDARNEARVCQALDVPPILVGAKVGLDRATYSNYEQARTAFWQDGLIPGVYQRVEDALDAGLSADGAWVAYDYSNVPALREDESKKEEAAVRLFLGGVARRNEARAKAGLEPVEIDGFRAADKQQVGAPALTQTAPAVLDEESDEDLAEDEDGVDETASGLDDDDDDVTPGSRGRRSQADDDDEAEDEKSRPFTRDRSTAADASAQDAKARDEGSLKARLRIERAGAAKVAKALRRQLRLALPKSTTAESVWEAVGRLDEGKQGVSDAIYQMMRAAAQLGLEVADGQVDEALHTKAAAGGSLEIDWALVNDAVLAWLQSYSFDLVRQIDDNSREALRKAIERWVRNGLPLQDLIDELAPMFGPLRAARIAATEVTRAFARANLIAWRASGVVEKWSIRTAADERVCSVCGPLGGVLFGEDGPEDTSIEEQERRAVVSQLGEGFVHPGGKGKAEKYAGMTFEMPPFHVNCRCWCVPEV